MRISASDSALHCSAMAMEARGDVAGLLTNPDRDRRSCREAVAIPHWERRCVPGHRDSATLRALRCTQLRSGWRSAIGAASLVAHDHRHSRTDERLARPERVARLGPRFRKRRTVRSEWPLLEPLARLLPSVCDRSEKICRHGAAEAEDCDY